MNSLKHLQILHRDFSACTSEKPVMSVSKEPLFQGLTTKATFYSLVSFQMPLQYQVYSKCLLVALVRTRSFIFLKMSSYNKRVRFLKVRLHDMIRKIYLPGRVQVWILVLTLPRNGPVWVTSPFGVAVSSSVK